MKATNAEATQLLCPMVTFRHCKGSKCAVWVWKERAQQGVKYAHNPNAESPGETRDTPPKGWRFVPASHSDEGAYFIEPPEHAEARRLGECGLVNH